VHASRHLVLTVALVAAVAIAAVGANLALLSSTQDSSDPVGRLSPRAVFSKQTEPAARPAPASDRSERRTGQPDD
jgi:hypothetical protein